MTLQPYDQERCLQPVPVRRSMTVSLMAAKIAMVCCRMASIEASGSSNSASCMPSTCSSSSSRHERETASFWCKRWFSFSRRWSSAADWRRSCSSRWSIGAIVLSTASCARRYSAVSGTDGGCCWFDVPSVAEVAVDGAGDGEADDEADEPECRLEDRRRGAAASRW